jgi:mannose-1-phosphate guanylyltransferase/phosphomannomutase
MKAMILAAGVGKRMEPLTLDTPKVLLPVGGIPIVEHTILWLKSHGISEIAINVHHLAEKVMDFLGDGSHLGVKIEYSVEERLLGTAGGVKKMATWFFDSFVVVCGDIYTDFNLSEMVSLHNRKRAMATLALFKANKPWEVGIVSINDDDLITGFTEKPSGGSAKGNLANGGVYVFNKQVLGYIPSEICCDFGRNIFPELTRHKLPIYGYLLEDDDYLIDIGTLDNYKKVNEEVKNARR